MTTEGGYLGLTLKSKYRIDALLGSGGMGEVYRARNTLLDRTVAIKVLRPELAVNRNVVERFMREAKAANVVRHRHIVDVLDIDSDESGALFIVQEYLEGEDLDAMLERALGRRLPVEEALAILVPVASAVGAAHKRGLVHRDLKPGNVFIARVEDESIPKVLDFGISKMALVPDERELPATESDGSVDVKLTAAGIAMGTPAYMSPEQIRDPSTVDARTDVWALGVILYETLSGSLPFDGESLGELFAQICTTEPKPLDRFVAGISPELTRIIWRCLRPEPSERYADARELARALLRTVEQSAGDTHLGTSAPAASSLSPSTSLAPSVSSPLDPSPAFAETQLTIDAIELDIAPRPSAPQSLPARRAAEPFRRPIASRAPMPADSTLIFRLVLGLILGVGTAIAALQLSAESVLSAQASLGAWGFAPFIAVALLMLIGGIFILVHAAKQISYVLFAAALACFSVAASCTVLASMLAAPGLVPETLRKLLLTAGPWGAAAIIASLALYALLHGLELRRDEEPGLWAHLLLAAAALGFGALIFVGRAAFRTPRELVALELASAEANVGARASQLGAMLEGARAIRRDTAPSISRSTRGGESAAAREGR